jgi:hypothetical protein
MNLKTIVLAAAVALAASIASLAHAATDQAKPLTGTWTGKTSQDIFLVDPASGETVENEWSMRLTISVLNGRILRLYTTIRSVCSGPAVRDHRVAKKWDIGRGPQVTRGGAFTVRLRGTRGTTVEIAGGLFASSGSGRLNVRAEAGCSGKGTWKLKRRLYG